MPELPEVETVCQALADAASGQEITSVWTSGKVMRWPIPADLEQKINGGTITGIRRRGKYILMDIVNHGRMPVTMLIHLGMSGSVRITPLLSSDKGDAGGEKAHDHLVLITRGKASGPTRHHIVLNDPRRFGGIAICRAGDEGKHPLLRNMGIEPLGNAMNGPFLLKAMAGKKTSIKTALLDQRIIAGIGNIYASEALFRAGISPRRQARNISAVRAEKLAHAIIDVLKDAIADGGTSLRDHVQPGGEIGYFVQRLDVYGREGEDCHRCTGSIRMIRQAGRASFYCSSCQR
ncbi:bifunctional DNA-formamidopyrimidine glycosylase/DNA-(apurinic or apyrimidinic site) lyase [Alphaproteobacteria bacterium LSUCC0684]